MTSFFTVPAAAALVATLTIPAARTQTFAEERERWRMVRNLQTPGRITIYTALGPSLHPRTAALVRQLRPWLEAGIRKKFDDARIPVEVLPGDSLTPAEIAAVRISGTREPIGIILLYFVGSRFIDGRYIDRYTLGATDRNTSIVAVDNILLGLRRLQDFTWVTIEVSAHECGHAIGLNGIPWIVGFLEHPFTDQLLMWDNRGIPTTRERFSTTGYHNQRAIRRMMAAVRH
jgi:hypothetical protein